MSVKVDCQMPRSVRWASVPRTINLSRALEALGGDVARSDDVAAIDTRTARQVERLEALHHISGMLHHVPPLLTLGCLSNPQREWGGTVEVHGVRDRTVGRAVQNSWPPASSFVSASVQIPMAAVTVSDAWADLTAEPSSS
jgi:hypothetical protein